MANVFSNSKTSYPPGHKVGMVVPHGGSNCEKCEYVQGKNCTNKYFQKWNDGPVIPAPIADYCCDFFESDKK